MRHSNISMTAEKNDLPTSLLEQLKTCYAPVNFALIEEPLKLEGWPSGLRRTPGKRVEVNASPGFESPSLRHLFS